MTKINIKPPKIRQKYASGDANMTIYTPYPAHDTALVKV